MTRKEYSAWIADLTASADASLAEIGEMAENRSWYLSDVFPCDGTFGSFAAAYPGFCQDETEFNDNIRDGWITLHDGYAAVWADGLI